MDNEKIYAKIADSLVKDGYLVMNDVFTKEFCNTLLDLAKDERGFKKAGISKDEKLHIDSTKRGDKTKWLDGSVDVEKSYLEFMNSLSEYLNRTLYLGLNYYEAHFAIYDIDEFYEKHLDAFKGSKNRVVTTVFYLNENWNKDDGGEIVLYNEDNNVIKTLTPISNTLVVFLSEKFPHEVLKSKKKRYSIAGWFRVDKKI